MTEHKFKLLEDNAGLPSLFEEAVFKCEICKILVSGFYEGVGENKIFIHFLNTLPSCDEYTIKNVMY